MSPKRPHPHSRSSNQRSGCLLAMAHTTSATSTGSPTTAQWRVRRRSLTSRTTMTHNFYSAYSVRLQLSHPQLKCGRYFYTTISQHYPAHLPPDRQPHFASGSLGFFPCEAADARETARPRGLAARPSLTAVAASTSRNPSLKNCNPRTGQLIPVSALQGPGPFALGHSQLPSNAAVGVLVSSGRPRHHKR